MAVKNMQTLASLVAEIQGVEVTGTGCAGSMRIDGQRPMPILSLFSLSRPGSYPMPKAPDADLSAAENAAAAKAALRAGRSRSASGAMPSTWSALPMKRTHG